MTIPAIKSPSRVARLEVFVLWGAVSACMACSGVIGDLEHGQHSDTPGVGGSNGGEAGSGLSGAGSVSGAAGSPSALCDPAVSNVSASPMRRLTRQEYAASIGDLLGVRNVDTATIPTDEKVGPFYSNAVSSITDLWTEQYMQSAESLAAAVDVDTLVDCNRATIGDTACALQFIDRFGKKVYRRPLSPDEQTMYTDLFAAYVSEGFASGIRMIVTTMLESPHFLYHVEFNSPVVATSNDVVPLGPYEIASRLSFFAWGSIPDDVLLAEASLGRLADPASIATQAERMFADARARDTLGAFHSQWLGMDADVAKDTAQFPSFTPALYKAMRDETTDFTDYVLRKGDGKLETLLTAPFSILTGPLSSFYGVKSSGAAGAVRVELDPAQRSGILTQANFLASHAHPNQTSPVSRGVVIRRNVLCQGLPDPPPNVNNVAPDPAANATARERFKAHEAEPSCGVCHRLIDGIGFGFEAYDATGAFRTMENGAPVDVSGQIQAGSTLDIDGAFNGAIELTRDLSTSQEVRACVAKQWFRFALGRPEGENDRCSVQASYDAFQAGQFDVRKLLTAIVTTDSFRYRRPGVQ